MVPTSKTLRVPNEPLVTREHQPITLGQSLTIDWDRLAKRRATILKHSTLSPYLILPEIHQILAYCKHANWHLLFNTLWHTGVRISEALSLTKSSFNLEGEDGSYVSVKTSKQRDKRRRPNNAAIPRLVPISDPKYLSELETYFATHKPKPREKLFSITRQGANKRLKVVLEQIKKDTRRKSPVHVGLHTFRHSFAINAVLHGVPLTVIQGWLGHSSIQSTIVYTQVMSMETHHLMKWMEF